MNGYSSQVSKLVTYILKLHISLNVIHKHVAHTSMWPTPPNTRSQNQEISHKQLHLVQLSTVQLPDVLGTYMLCVLSICICCTCVVLIAVARPLPLLQPPYAQFGQLVHERPLLLLIEHPPQLYTCAQLPFFFFSAGFLYVVF